MITSAIASDGPGIIKLFADEKEIWPAGGKLVWHRFLQNNRRAERWDKIVIDGEIVAFVHWAMRADNTRTIYDMIVSPAYRKQGLGRLLIAHVGTPVELKTTHSQKFYERLGFIRGHTVDGKTDYYMDKERVIVPSNAPWIMTYTGKVVNPLDLKPEDICIEDIAHQLACVNRFAGALAKPVSVAQHSVYVSRLCEGTQFMMQGLLHDASEAYLGDVTKWLKADPTFAVYRLAEELAMRIILEKFHCNPILQEPVLRADRVMVLWEAPRGFGKAWTGGHLKHKKGYEPITALEEQLIGAWSPWNWRAAEEAFMVRYRRCLEPTP